MSNDDERQERIAQIRARVEAATTDVVNELAGFRDFDAEWLANKTHRQRASPGGVRETFYAAGRLSGLAETSNAPADFAYLLSELDAATARAERAEAALRNALDGVGAFYNANGWLHSDLMRYREQIGNISRPLRAALAEGA
jgi:hypothetical protein